MLIAANTRRAKSGRPWNRTATKCPNWPPNSPNHSTRPIGRGSLACFMTPAKRASRSRPILRGPMDWMMRRMIHPTIRILARVRAGPTNIGSALGAFSLTALPGITPDCPTGSLARSPMAHCACGWMKMRRCYASLPCRSGLIIIKRSYLSFLRRSSSGKVLPRSGSACCIRVWLMPIFLIPRPSWTRRKALTVVAIRSSLN